VRSLALAAALFAALLVVQPVRAQPAARSRVVIAARSDATDRAADVSRRIAAELRLAGFEVIIEHVAPVGAPEPPPAGGAAHAGVSAPFARIVLTSTGEIEADVWVHHPVSGVPSARRVDAHDVEAASSQGALAIRAVETLRGAMFNLSRDPKLVGALAADVLAWAEASPEAAAEQPPPVPPATPPATPRQRPAARPSLYLLPAVDVSADAPAPPPPVPEKPEVPSPRDQMDSQTWIGGGFSTLGAFGSLGLSFGPRLSVQHELPYSFSIGASAIGMFPVHNVGADAHQFVGLGEGVYRFGRKGWPVQPHVDLGLGVHAYETARFVAATTSSPSGKQVGVGFAIASGFGADFPIGSHVRIALEIAALFVIPEPVIAFGFDHTDGARTPMITSSLGLELAP